MLLILLIILLHPFLYNLHQNYLHPYTQTLYYLQLIHLYLKIYNSKLYNLYTFGFKHIKSSTLLYLGFVFIDSSFKNSYVLDNTVNILSKRN